MFTPFVATRNEGKTPNNSLDGTLYMLRFLLLACSFLAIAPLSAEPKLPPHQVPLQKIFDDGRYNSFTDLARFDGAYYCTFRSAISHGDPGSGVVGNIVVIRSEDLTTWQEVARFTLQGVDLRDPKLTATPHGIRLYAFAGEISEAGILQYRTAAWSSADGRHWSGPVQMTPGYIFWRPKWHAGKFHVPAYLRRPGYCSVDLLVSENGDDWRLHSTPLHQYGMKPEHLMNVAIKNHDNASLNPNAQFGVTIQKWMEGRIAAAIKKGKPAPTWSTIWDFLHDESGNPPVAWPLRLLDCSPVSDGAAAVLLVAEERAHEFTDHPVHIIGSGQSSDSALHDRPELTTIPAAKIASSKAYEMAGVTAKDIRIAEVHDCFTIAEVIASEDLGFFAPGEGFKAAEDGMTARNGSKPINTSGGLQQMKWCIELPRASSRLREEEQNPL